MRHSMKVMLVIMVSHSSPEAMPYCLRVLRRTLHNSPFSSFSKTLVCCGFFGVPFYHDLTRHSPFLLIDIERMYGKPIAIAKRAEVGKQQKSKTISQHDLLNKYFRRDALVLRNVDLLR